MAAKLERDEVNDDLAKRKERARQAKVLKANLKAEKAHEQDKAAKR